jgi:hypothetical protein
MEGHELPHELSASTRLLLHQAAEAFEAEELKAILADGQNLISFTALDKATRIAIDSIARAIADGQTEEIVSYCGSVLITGYLVGRAMVRTVGGALHFSNPLTEADNAATMIRISTTDAADQIDGAIRPTGDLFVKLAIEMANQAGPVSPLPEQVRVGLVGGSAVAGMRLAIVEHDLFVAEGPGGRAMDEHSTAPQQDPMQRSSIMSEEPPRVSTERDTQLKFVMAITSANEAMGLGDDFPLEAGAKGSLEPQGASSVWDAGERRCTDGHRPRSQCPPSTVSEGPRLRTSQQVARPSS